MKPEIKVQRVTVISVANYPKVKKKSRIHGDTKPNAEIQE